MSLSVGQNVFVKFISSSRTEFSNQHIEGLAVLDRIEDGYVLGRLKANNMPFMCNESDVTVLPKNIADMQDIWAAEFDLLWEQQGQYQQCADGDYRTFAWWAYQYCKEKDYENLSLIEIQENQIQEYMTKLSQILNHFVWSADDAADKQKKATTAASINYYEGKRHVYDVEQARLQQILDSKPQV